MKLWADQFADPLQLFFHFVTRDALRDKVIPYGTLGFRPDHVSGLHPRDHDYVRFSSSG